LDFLTLEDGTDSCPETSVKDYNFTLRNIPKECRSQTTELIIFIDKHKGNINMVFSVKRAVLVFTVNVLAKPRMRLDGYMKMTFT
jgi:hypothetical protein